MATPLAEAETKTAFEKERGLLVCPALGRLAALAREVDAPAIAAEALASGQRIAEGRFYVACVGQFKRGKSTLLNALIGRPFLPVGVTPVTSVVTVIRYGEIEGARVRFVDGGWREIEVSRLVDYVSEQFNSENRLGVSAVEAFIPSPLLAEGMCLVDTPGIGSVFEGNTEATRSFVPHVDAALVVLGADPPISGEELALVEDVAGHVHDLVLVLNKADRLAEHEREEAARFTEHVLARRLGRPVPRLLQVSATERFGDQPAPDRDWPGLVAALERLATDAGATLLLEAERRETARLAARIVEEADEQIGALRRPVEESERRIGELTATLTEAERSMGDLGHLFMAEEERLRRRLETDRDAFLAESLPTGRLDVRAAGDQAGSTRRGALREALREAARQAARKQLDAWLSHEKPAAERLYRAASERFVSTANDFLARFLHSGEVGLASLPSTLGSEAGFRERSHLYYTDLMAATAPPPLTWLLDRVLPAGTVRRSARADGARVLERLLRSNSARLQNDLIDRTRESRRKLEAEIRGRLFEALRSATTALERARARQAAGAGSVKAELDRLESVRQRTLEAREGAPAR